MTQQRDIERLLDHWLSEGAGQAPDRVVDIVTDRIERQSQRPAWRLQWRPRTVNAYAKIAVAAAAVLIVAVVGYNILPGSSTSEGGPAATPSPSATPSPVASASPSAAPSASAVLPTWYSADDFSGAGILSSGSHTTRSFTPGFTYSVPDGWVNDSDSADFFALFPDTPANRAEFARSGALAQSIYMGLHRSPWFVCESVESNLGATAAEMVAAMVANEALATTGLVDVAIGGLTGKQFDVRLDPDWTGTCPPSPDDPPGFDLGDTRTRGLLLDVPGRGVLVIFAPSLHSADHEAFVAKAMPVIESFQFDTGQ